MIDSIFIWRSVRRKHTDAPLLAERERYLAHLVKLGYAHERVQTTARMLLEAIRLLHLEVPRKVHPVDIERAKDAWAESPVFRSFRQTAGISPAVFQKLTTEWLQFVGLLGEPEPVASPMYSGIHQGFLEQLRKRGVTRATLNYYRKESWNFLRWYADRSDNLQRLTVADVDDYLRHKREAGCRDVTIASTWRAIQGFLCHTEAFGLSRAGIRRSVRTPRFSKREESGKGPTWRDVRRLLRPSKSDKPHDHKTRAIIALAAIYGFRASEIGRLTLDDLDWINETITVHRVKNERVQQFPLQYEVGQLIIAYLKQGRPRCASRNLFVTRGIPRRAIEGNALWNAVSNRMRTLSIKSRHIGPHALRHSCATQLLKKGTPIQSIADFLGHRDMQSVGIYAKYDARTLKAVSRFSLGSVL